MEGPEPMLGTVVRALAGGGEGAQESIFESGNTNYRQRPMEIGLAFISIVVVTIVADTVLHKLSHVKNETTKAFINAVLKEIMLLGLISLGLAICQDLDAFGADLIHVYEFLHISLFLVALFYIVSMVFLWFRIKRQSQLFSDFELYCVTCAYFSEDGRSSWPKDAANADLPSETGPKAPVTAEKLVPVFLVDRVQLKQDVYAEWAQQAPWTERLQNWRLALMARRWRQIVSYNRFRSVFIQQCQADSQLAPHMNNNFQFARFLRKRLRNEAILAASIGRFAWVVLAVVVGLNVLRIALSREKRRNDDEHDAGHDRYLASSADELEYEPINLRGDVIYWTIILYVLLVSCLAVFYELHLVYRAFRHQQEANYEIDTVLGSLGTIDKEKREEVRKAVGSTIFLREYYSRFVRVKPIVLPLVKSVYLLLAWIFVLFITVLSEYLLTIGVGTFIGVVFLVAFPFFVIYYSLIPRIIMITGILLAVGSVDEDVEEDREDLKKLIKHTNRGFDKGLAVAASRRSKDFDSRVMRSFGPVSVPQVSPPKLSAHERNASVSLVLDRVHERRAAEEEQEQGVAKTLRGLSRRFSRLSLGELPLTGSMAPSLPRKASEAYLPPDIGATSALEATSRDEMKSSRDSIGPHEFRPPYVLDGVPDAPSGIPQSASRSPASSTDVINFTEIYGQPDSNDHFQDIGQPSSDDSPRAARRRSQSVDSGTRQQAWSTFRDQLRQEENAAEGGGRTPSVRLIKTTAHHNNDDSESDEESAAPRVDPAQARLNAMNRPSSKDDLSGHKPPTTRANRRKLRERRRESLMQSDATDEFLRSCPASFKATYSRRATSTANVLALTTPLEVDIEAPPPLGTPSSGNHSPRSLSGRIASGRHARPDSPAVIIEDVANL